MLTYREALENQRRYHVFYEINTQEIRSQNKNNATDIVKLEGENNMSFFNEEGSNKQKFIPGSIRQLLKRLIEREITIVLDAETPPEKVEVEAVVGDLLVAETEDRRIKFVDINCICEIIIDREELLESIFHQGCCENQKEDINEDCNKHKRYLQ